MGLKPGNQELQSSLFNRYSIRKPGQRRTWTSLVSSFKESTTEAEQSTDPRPTVTSLEPEGCRWSSAVMRTRTRGLLLRRHPLPGPGLLQKHRTVVHLLNGRQTLISCFYSPSLRSTRTRTSLYCLFDSRITSCL